MTTPRSRSTEFMRRVVAVVVRSLFEDPTSNADLVPAVVKFNHAPSFCIPRCGFPLAQRAQATLQLDGERAETICVDVSETQGKLSKRCDESPSHLERDELTAVECFV